MHIACAARMKLRTKALVSGPGLLVLTAADWAGMAYRHASAPADVRTLSWQHIPTLALNGNLCEKLGDLLPKIKWKSQM